MHTQTTWLRRDSISTGDRLDANDDVVFFLLFLIFKKMVVFVVFFTMQILGQHSNVLLLNESDLLDFLRYFIVMDCVLCVDYT